MKITTLTDWVPTPADWIIPVAGETIVEEAISWCEAKGNITFPGLRTDFQGKAGEIQVVYHAGGRFFLLGLGKTPLFIDILKAFRSLTHRCRSKWSASLGLYWGFGAEGLRGIEAAANGVAMGVCQPLNYKTDTVTPHPLEQDDAILSIVAPELSAAAVVAMANRGQLIGRTQQDIASLVDLPANYKLPHLLAEKIQAIGDKAGFSVRLLKKTELEAQGFHALLAVGQGSSSSPVFVVMEYIPANPVARTVGLVGKGVTFDTGGLSIKPSTNMHYMKSDMGGAAAVIGTMAVAAQLQLPVHLIAATPLAENSVDGLSVRPSDVIGSYSGKTIEVIDTDAEGRLILADALAYITRNYTVDTLIDLATLTGSTVRTLGSVAGGLFSNNDQLAEKLLATGQQCGELLWRLPLWDAYSDDIKSDVADVRNFSGKPYAGAISAAKFLEVFIHDHPKWAHLDIAGVAFVDSEFTTLKAASGYGVRLLVEYLLADN